MSFESYIPILQFGKHLVWSRPNEGGGITYYYYYDAYTWAVAVLTLAWLGWFLVVRRRRALALRRWPRHADYDRLKQIVRIKNELSSRYLRPDLSINIHAVGIGLLAGDYCIQVFVSDATDELWVRSGPAPLPADYRGVPLVLVEMPLAGFLLDSGSEETAISHASAIREHQDVIIGGISGANANLTGQSGTIGYFCARRTRFPGRKEVHLLSNSHVFADLRKGGLDDADLIMQPSPGEPGPNRPIGSLVGFSPVKFHRGPIEPNHIDAAIARLWARQEHKPVLPLIGAVKGYVPKRDVQLGEAARKFGRTTGYTEGRVFSIYLDIWIRYDRTRQSAFFQNQILIEPNSPGFSQFVAKGDSGSLVVDEHRHALGLIFAGKSDVQDATVPANIREAIDARGEMPRRIEGYGVANPISEVLDRLKIDLLV